MSSAEFKMLIGGELVSSSNRFAVENPATAELAGYAPDIESQQVEQVLAAAESGFSTFSKMSLAEREKMIVRFAELLEDNKEIIIEILIQETGKPLENAEYDFGMLTTCLKYFVEEAKRLDQPVIVDPDNRFHHYVQRQPLGVVVGYLAWNFPLLNVGYKLGPALAAGCSVILKPSQVTPLATLKVAELAVKAGFPAGVINVISSNNYEVTNPLLTSSTASLFTMIGSTNAGVKCMEMACTDIKHFSVELGGNAPVVVYDDADLEKAVKDIVGLKFGNSGQVCVSPNRCFVHQSVYKQFVEQAKTLAEAIELGAGDSHSGAQQMGPVINDKERSRIIKLVEASVEQGATLVTGGDIPASKQQGYYLSPTVLSDVSLDMPVITNEIFGPVLPIVPFSDQDDVIALANQSEFGLAAYVYTSNLQRGMAAASQITAGSVCINEAHYSVQLPHGGLKQSGIGKDCSKYSLQEYLTNKRVSILIGD